MLKLLGAMMILLAGTLFGFYQAQQYSRRPKQIADMIRSLQRLETEIVYGHTPLEEALRKVEATCPQPVNAVFRSAAEELAQANGRSVQHIWQHAIAEHWKNTSMKGGEQEIVRQLGFTLGLSDSGDQVKHLRLALQQLQGELEGAQEERKRYESMWRSLGLLMGALIVILMY
ncbi:stage III sporulation protein SpoAB [Paenibacillus konkukensis]|uniref:Stage III sporulation protein SpoAB n=1 Tax=Paenibacillus konkukensis TaxID=2020716 RepID=A0ABY4RIW0_9BACL|nr:stage III sporulation protein SpoIIIAB [Paenibacillus konkukensis]UQZ82073.1 stage III sporulation protein SpoAB [Paenibacillus konkukensis]